MSEFIEIPQHPGYGISRNGEVINLKTGKPQRQYIAPNGYLSVSLGLARKCRHIHRLLAEAFLHRPSQCRVVHHKDHNKLNNTLENLEWSSYSNNTKQSYLAGRTRGIKVTDSIRDYILSANGEIASAYWAKKFNIGARHVRKIMTGESRPVSIRRTCHS